MRRDGVGGCYVRTLWQKHSFGFSGSFCFVLKEMTWSEETLHGNHSRWKLEVELSPSYQFSPSAVEVCYTDKVFDVTAFSFFWKQCWRNVFCVGPSALTSVCKTLVVLWSSDLSCTAVTPCSQYRPWHGEKNYYGPVYRSSVTLWVQTATTVAMLLRLWTTKKRPSIHTHVCTVAYTQLTQ